MQYAQQAHLPVRLLTRINCLCWAPVRGCTLLPPALRHGVSGGSAGNLWSCWCGWLFAGWQLHCWACVPGLRHLNNPIGSAPHPGQAAPAEQQVGGQQGGSPPT